MEKLKLAVGWLLIIWGIYGIGASAGYLFFPEFFFEHESLAIMREMRDYMMAYPTFLLQTVIEETFVDILPIIAGLFVLKISIETIRRFYGSVLAKLESAKQSAKAKPAINSDIAEDRNPRLRAAQLVIAIGCALLAYAAFMDISVAVGYGNQRVVNLDLISRRQTLLTLGAIAVACGVVFLLVAKGRLTGSSTTHENVSASTLRECPQCAELIQIKAVKCRFCQSDVPPREVITQ